MSEDQLMSDHPGDYYDSEDTDFTDSGSVDMDDTFDLGLPTPNPSPDDHHDSDDSDSSETDLEYLMAPWPIAYGVGSAVCCPTQEPVQFSHRFLQNLECSLTGY